MMCDATYSYMPGCDGYGGGYDYMPPEQYGGMVESTAMMYLPPGCDSMGLMYLPNAGEVVAGEEAVCTAANDGKTAAGSGTGSEGSAATNSATSHSAQAAAAPKASYSSKVKARKA